MPSLSNGWAVARIEGCGLWEWQDDHESPYPELLSEDDGSDGLMTGFSREIIPQTVVGGVGLDSRMGLDIWSYVKVSVPEAGSGFKHTRTGVEGPGIAPGQSLWYNVCVAT